MEANFVLNTGYSSSVFIFLLAVSCTRLDARARATGEFVQRSCFCKLKPKSTFYLEAADSRPSGSVYYLLHSLYYNRTVDTENQQAFRKKTMFPKMYNINRSMIDSDDVILNSY